MASMRQNLVRDIIGYPPFEGHYSVQNLGEEALKWAGKPVGAKERDYLSRYRKSIFGDLLFAQERLVNAGGIKGLITADRDALRLRSIGSAENYAKRRRVFLRSIVFRWLDGLTDRQYEFASALAMERIGASQYMVTPSGDEYGADFFAIVPVFSRHDAFFSKRKGVRIVGQAKMYTDPVAREKIQNFNDLMNALRYDAKALEGVAPGWFRASKLPMVGCFVSNFGYQSGASTLGYQYGNLLFDSFLLAELIGDPRAFSMELNNSEIEAQLWSEMARIESTT